MRSVLALPFVIGMTLAVADYDGARAISANPRPLSAVAPASDIQLVRSRGGRGGAVAVRGPRGGAAARGPRGGVAVRGAYGGAAVRGPRGGVAARGAYGGAAVRGPRGNVAVRGARGGAAVRVGARYHGGIWHGTGRRYWRGRWWAYGVGSCWRWTEIGYVWICGV
jgi:hypothetical protein